MQSIAVRRKKLMDHLKMILNSLDPSGDNYKKYEERFKAMTDEQFDRHIKTFFKSKTSRIYLEFVEYERQITIENIVKTAEKMKVPLMERVAYPYLNNDKSKVVVTPEPVPVGYLHIKRMPQTLLKKSAGSTKIEKRSILTGQVTGDDKNVRNSNLETYSLVTLGAMNAVQEFLGPRADNMLAKDQMYKDIAKNGYASLDDLTLDDPYTKIALNTLDAYYIMMGIKTNLVTEENKLPGPR